ncbi:ABC transporter permease [Bifidobacterium amazonense]|uniref:ABC transporter permease n=1 Tax=Bifidobacterium amazonense TaxID=2809027 RepID=A0ABS9VSX4_9BIFI|nr:ABC transporter permease [Bifidobacterium amazonense]MCH9275090.1 ABC transporter permease [Bifidobacterium amazonense]
MSTIAKSAAIPTVKEPLLNRIAFPEFLRRGNLQLWLGVVIVGFIVLCAICAPLLTRYSPTDQDMTAVLLEPGSAGHVLGTDNLGRDVLSRLLYGARTDLSVTLIAAIIPFVAGSLIGALCGYFGKWFDVIVMRLADIVTAFPFYVLVIALVFAIGNGTKSIYIAISAVSWVAYARIVRGEAMVVRRKEFIDACVSSGLPTWMIILRHVLPNTLSQSVVYVMSDIVMNVNVIVTLSFFGLGIVPPTPDWGQMMSDGQQFILSGSSWLTLIPGLTVVLFSLGLSFLGDGLSNIIKARS